MADVRWGIVSAGHIAGTFARDVAYAENARVTTVAARSGDAAAKFAAAHGIPGACEGYEALFADPDIDAVYVATPHTLHLPHTLAAFDAGKAALCEKPVTTSAEDFRTMRAAAARTDRYLMEGMWTWFLPAIVKAKEWVDAGRIGELRHVKADFGYPITYDPEKRVYNAELAGGCLFDMGIYPVALARLFTSRAPSTIEVVSRFAPNGVDDDVVMLCNYEDCVATLATSFRCKLQNAAYIIGTEGYIAIPDFWRARECSLYVLHDVVDTFADDRRGSGFEFQIAAVSKDILQGRKESPVVTHAASLAFQEDMDRVRAKFRPGRRQSDPACTSPA